METDAVEENRLFETRELEGIRLFLDLLFAVQIFEHALRCAERLLKNIMDPGEALDRLIEHEQGDDEADEIPSGHRAMFNLYASVGDQADDGDGSEELNERRGD